MEFVEKVQKSTLSAEYKNVWGMRTNVQGNCDRRSEREKQDRYSEGQTCL